MADFWQDLVLVIIPVASAFFTTKFVLETWQDRKIKYELQEKILDQLDLAHTNFVSDLWATVYKVAINYFDERTYKYFPEKHEIYFDSITELPKNMSLPPIELFREDYDIMMKKEMWKCEKHAEKFWSTIMNYYGTEKDNPLKETRSNLYGLNQKTIFAFWHFFHSEDTKSLHDNLYDFYKQFHKERKKIREIKSTIINTKMKKKKI